MHTYGQDNNTLDTWVLFLISHWRVYVVWLLRSWIVPFSFACCFRINSRLENSGKGSELLTFSTVKALLTYCMYGLGILNVALLGGHKRSCDTGTDLGSCSLTTVGAEGTVVSSIHYLLFSATVVFIVSLCDA
jgi:hypothetical protein